MEGTAMAASAMLLRVSGAVRRLLPLPGTETQTEGQQGAAGGAGARRRRCTQSSDEEDLPPWKRIKMGELADSVRRAAQGVWNTTGEVLSWLKNRGLSPHPPLPPPPDPPPPSTDNPARPVRRSRRGTPACGRSPSQDSSIPRDESFCIPYGDSSWTPVAGPVSASLPRERALRGGGDEGGGLSRRPLHSPRSLRTPHRHSRGGPAPTPPRGAVPAQRPSRTPSPRCPPVPPPPPPPQTPATSNPRITQRTPKRGRPKMISTVEESIRREEREIYRQLLEVVTSDYERSASFPFSSPPSRRCPDSTPKDPAPTPPECLPEGRGEPLIADEPPPCLPPWIASSCSPQRTSDTPSSHSPSLPLETMATDTLSTGSDTESVIVVKVKEAPRRQNQRMPSFDAVLWIRELTSMYDYRARERRRLIEEQEALAERLRQQRLQERLPEWGRAGSQLRLTVPLVEEVPIGDVLHREIAPEIGQRERGDGAPERDEEEEEEELPEITEEMQDEVFRAFRAGNQDEVLTEGFRLTITRKDIHTLSHLNWLNDEVINFYMNLLVERSKSRSLPSVHAFNTFFFPKIRSDGYAAVKRWTKRADIFSNDLLLVPIHLGVHWCLAVVDFRKKTISYYDSMGGSNQEACRILLRYIQEESLDKRKQELDVKGWSLGSKRSQDIPQQMNGSDCGMFTCKYADYVSRDKPLRFTQKDMPFFRQLVAWEILHQTLL